MYHFDPGVCSLRFDFETFTTAGPTTTVDANGCPDTLVITAVSIYRQLLSAKTCQSSVETKQNLARNIFAQKSKLDLNEFEKRQFKIHSIQ